MKKILFLIFIPLVALCVGMQLYSTRPPSGGGGGTDACGTSYGTYLWLWTGDHASGAGYACYDSDDHAEDYESTSGAAAIDSTDISVSSTNGNYEWDVEAGDGLSSVDDTATTICATITFTDDGDATEENVSVFEVQDGAGTYNYCYMYGTQTAVWCLNESGHNVSVAATIDTQYRLCYSWSSADNKHSMSLVAKGNATNYTDEDFETINATATAIDNFCIGEHYDGKDSADQLDLEEMVVMTGYQATDPNP